ncbi:hypothetical protein GCM10025868_16620 [Angustibacter aerolatus]|uniref:Periplasmic copper-binding protein NosD beta helix domain-containing protein n=1 Tax=Angustibacter aerolatus TaxID=1162965 RepID=A0ABQ6JDZ4_9ACTN|nr:NosD domain-containing protein [Angustibacter aerolatus]GMA86412.1 hypothetical protein GCM10025868_16620 [Angustibacter aerolatus]
MHRGTTGVDAFDSRLVLRANEVRGTDVGVTTGLTSDGTDDVTLNRFSGNGVGLRLGTFSRTSLQRNRFERNGTGVGTAASDEEHTLEAVRNTFDRNHDGMLLDVGTNRLGRNVVRDSTDWGIRAPGAVDLGGNVATGNGHVPQCLGVTC